MTRTELVGTIFSHENVSRVVKGNRLFYQCEDCKLTGNRIQAFEQYGCDPDRDH